MKYVTTIGERDFLVEILDDHHVALDGVLYEIDFESLADQPVYSLLLDGYSHEAYVYPREEEWQVLLQGRLYPAKVEDEREKRLRLSSGIEVSERGEYHLRAPMPGLVVAVQVAEGQEVDKGDVLVVLESMKMQNELKAPRKGAVARVRVRPGERVEQKQILLNLT
jgi:biotin carboxyl carrier protein